MTVFQLFDPPQKNEKLVLQILHSFLFNKIRVHIFEKIFPYNTISSTAHHLIPDSCDTLPSVYAAQCHRQTPLDSGYTCTF